MKKEVIVALDFPGRKKTVEFLELFEERKLYVKVGMELFYNAGPEIIKDLKGMGHRVFLDLKLHDIPNTIEHAMAALAKMDIDMCNLHAAGTREMMEAGLRGLKSAGGKRPVLLAVTQLTSTDEETMQRELLIEEGMNTVVKWYAMNAKAAGLDGVVCSPLEAPVIHDTCGQKFLTVTPGVRFPGGKVGDQKRVTTPEEARNLGADYIIMGRPITKAEDPVAAYRRALKEFGIEE